MITVTSGDTVTFVNKDQMSGGHTIVADDGTFSSPPLGKDESWSHTFNAVGDHGYSTCSCWSRSLFEFQKDSESFVTQQGRSSRMPDCWGAA